MIEKNSESLLAKLLLIGPAFVSILVFSTGVTDPVNANKLLALGVVSFATLGSLTARSVRQVWNSHKALVIGLLGFIFASLNSIVQSDSPITQQMYGVYGRNNGFLLYLFLIIIFFATLNMTQLSTATNVVRSIVIAGLINLVYCGWVLVFGDFIGWSNPYGNILGTFGNPNFIGAFLGMFSSVLVSIAITTWRNKRLSVVVIIGILITVVEIIKSHAIQGRVLLVFGLAINGFFLIRSRYTKKAPLIVFSAGALIAGIVGLLGTLQIGPLAKILYKESVSLRGEYWFAGLKMGLNNLVSGVGFDSYGDWYRLSRRASALVRPGPETVSNASHNVVIDIFAFGGLPLLIFYIGILVLVATSIVKYMRLNRKFDYAFVSMVGAWLCFQLQSLISINQVGLAVWGWVLGGCIVAYVRIAEGNSSEDRIVGKSKSKNLSQAQIVTPNLKAGVAIAVGILIAVPPFAADVKWRSAQESRDASKVEAALNPTYFNPPSTFKYLQLVGAFEESNLPDQAHKYAIQAVEFNPRSYETWRLYTLIRNATQEEKKLAEDKMLELDPKNPNLKSGSQ